MWADDRVGVALRIGPIAGPAILARMTYHSGAHGVQLDVAMTDHQICIAVDRRCAISPFPQGSGAAPRIVHVAHIATAERLHRARKAFGALRRQQQVDVVGHQHVGMDVAAVFPHGGQQPSQENFAILVRMENRLPVVAALDHMQRLFRHKVAAKPSHESSIRSQFTPKSTLTPFPLAAIVCRELSQHAL
jgi:hypothetical protein